MKHTKVISSLILFISLAFFSCEDMHEIYYDYVKDGETIYTTKLDSVESYAGNNRVNIQGILYKPYGVTYIQVYYNDGQDSLMLDYVNKHEIDSIDIVIDNLEEKSYNFDIYTMDEKGNRSVRVGLTCSSYGELYREGLLRRDIKFLGPHQDTLPSDTLKIVWFSSNESERGSELVYTDNLGTEQTVVIPENAESTLLPEYGSGLKYFSKYVPEATAIDSFNTDWTERELGMYDSHGTFLNPILGLRNFAKSKVLDKTGDNIYETEFADMVDLGYRLIVTVNTDNTLSLKSAGEAPELLLNGDNYYDPAGDVYQLNYLYPHITGDRVISERLSAR